MTSSRHNPLRSYRFLVPGILAVVLGAGWTPATAQTTADAARRNESVLTSPLAEVAAGPQARRYTQTFTASGGAEPYTFTVTGNIPAGMSWTQAENGLLLDGVPMAVGDFPLSIKVTDQTGQVTSHDYVLHVTPYDTGSSLNTPVSEAVSVTDVPVIGFAIPVSVSESVSVSDTPSVVFPLIVSVTEAVSVADSVSFPNFVFVSVTEGVAVSDTISFPTVASVSVAEAMQVADSVSLPSVASVSAVETVSVADTVSFPDFVLVSVGESVSVSDSVSLPTVTSIAVTEAVSVNDTVSLGSPIAITVTEPISVTDVVSALPPQASQTINLGPLPTPTYGGAPFSVSATATSGLPVTIAYVSGPATGSGSGPYTATGAGTVNFTATQAGNAKYAAAAPVNFSVNIAPASQNITLGALPTPTYGGASFSLSATATSGLPVTISYVSGPATGSGNGPYTATGGGVVNFTATQTGNANYAAATPVNFSVTVAPAVPVLAFAAIPAHTYGDAPFTVSASSASSGAVTYSLLSGAATVSSGGLVTLTGAGSLTLAAQQAATTNYTSATTQTSLSIAKQASVTSVTTSSQAPTPVQNVTLTATVAPLVTGTPSGTVTFFDNGVQSGSPVNVAGGQAQLVTTLLSGPQTISATYSGDANFLPSSGTDAAPVVVAPLDFTLNPLGTVNLNVVPGQAASFSFNVTPLYAIYPGPVSFAITGLPTGATASITPNNLPATGGAQTVTVTIQTPAALVQNTAPRMPLSRAPIALALLLPALAWSGLRRRRRWISGMLLVIAGVCATSALSGCGTSGNGYFGHAQKTYPLTITATSGTVQHTINVSFVVQ
jgi:hypothetical protein